MTSKTAAIYVRISDDQEGDKLGVARQESACRELADRLGLTVVAVFRDDSASAYAEGRVRPGFEDLMDAAERGEFSHVLAWASDRLYRRMDDLVRITRELARWVQINTVNGGEVDLTTSEGILRAQVLGSVAEFESRRKGERVKDKWKQRSEAGWSATGQLPTGWMWKAPCPADEDCQHKLRKDGTRHAPGALPRKFSRAGIVPHPEHSLHVAEAYRMIANDASLRTVYRYLTANGIQITPGAAVKLMLKNPRNCGKAALNGVVVADAASGDALVSRELWEEVQLKLDDRATRMTTYRGGRPANKPLSGLLRCWKCGGHCHGGRGGADGGEYRCSEDGCFRASVRRDPANAAVVSVVAELLTRLDGKHALAAARPTADTAAASAEIARVEADLAAMSGLLAEGAITPHGFAVGEKALRDRLHAATRVLVSATVGRNLAAVLNDRDGAAAALRRAVDNPDTSALRKLLGDLIVRIDLHEDKSLTIQWQEGLGSPPGHVPSLHPRRVRDEEVFRLWEQGEHKTVIAEKLGLHVKTVSRIIRAHMEKVS